MHSLTMKDLTLMLWKIPSLARSSHFLICDFLVLMSNWLISSAAAASKAMATVGSCVLQTAYIRRTMQDGKLVGNSHLMNVGFA